MSICRIALGFSLLACILSPANAQQQTTVIPDNLFTQAGFVVKYATTPEKAAILRSLPPDKLVTRRKDGKLYYVYADAARCNCAYVGTPEAFARYRKTVEFHSDDRFRCRWRVHTRGHRQQHGEHSSAGLLGLARLLVAEIDAISAGHYAGDV
jgi:hypothetical protein